MLAYGLGDSFTEIFVFTMGGDAKIVGIVIEEVKKF